MKGPIIRLGSFPKTLQFLPLPLVLVFSCIGLLQPNLTSVGNVISQVRICYTTIINLISFQQDEVSFVSSSSYRAITSRLGVCSPLLSVKDPDWGGASTFILLQLPQQGKCEMINSTGAIRISPPTCYSLLLIMLIDSHQSSDHYNGSQEGQSYA